MQEELEHPFSAIVIRERLPDQQRGNALAWIELLSPSTKGETRSAAMYLANRQMPLRRGLVFVALDFLHETPPTFTRLVDYSRRQRSADAHPYRILVLDWRPRRCR